METHDDFPGTSGSIEEDEIARRAQQFLREKDSVFQKKRLVRKHTEEYRRRFNEIKRENQKIEDKIVEEREESDTINRQREFNATVHNDNMEFLKSNFEVLQMEMELNSTEESNQIEQLFHEQETQRYIHTEVHRHVVIGIVHERQDNTRQLNNKLDEFLYSLVVQMKKNVTRISAIITNAEFTASDPGPSNYRIDLKTELDELAEGINCFRKRKSSTVRMIQNSGSDATFKRNVQDYMSEIESIFGQKFQKHEKILKQACQHGIIRGSETVPFIQQLYENLKKPFPSQIPKNLLEIKNPSDKAIE